MILGNRVVPVFRPLRRLNPDLYRHAKHACRKGWSAIRDTAYNGQYSTAQAEYHQGLCDIKQSNDIIVRLPVHRTTHQHNNRLRTVTRPNGVVYTFVRQNQQWKTLSKALVQLKRNRNHWVFTDLDGSIEKYSHYGLLLNITNAESQTTSLKYDYIGRLKKIKDQFGNKQTFSYRHYWWGNQLKKVTSPSGTVKYSYNREDRLSKAKYQDGSTQTYRYQEDRCENCLTEIINAADETEQKISYDQQGRVNSTEGANGSNQRNFSYSNDEVIVSDSAEAETHFKFNLHHGVLKIATLTDATGQSETFGYDQNGYPANHIAKNGNITETEYNQRGLLAVTIENAGTDAERETATQWHPDFRKPTERAETNQTTNFDYDNSGRLTQQIQSPNDDNTALRNTNGAQQQEQLEQRITAFAYDELGQITKTISPSGASRTQSYDQQGNRTSTTNALGHKTQTLAFDTAGRALKSQDSNGIITENQYDTAGRLLKTTANGQSTSYQYDSAGRQIKVTFPDDTFTENQYDGSGRIIKTINQRGDTTENTYDTNGNRTKTQVTDAQGNIVAKTETSYNLLNQAIQTTDAEGNNTSFEYDASGNQTKITDAKSNITQNQYDSQNRLTKTIDALGGETSYQYDINGNRTNVIAANGASTRFTYDNFNQLTAENSPDRGQTQYSYDISGNRTQTTDANSHTKQTQYDDLNRKTQESWVDHPELTINYTYDSCDNGIGKLCQVTDASGYTSYQYNTGGLVTQKGRYVRSDPFGLDGGMNGFGYASSNSIINIDAWGLVTLSEANSSLGALGAAKLDIGFFFDSYTSTQVFEQWLILEEQDKGWDSDLPKCPRSIDVTNGLVNPNPAIWENPTEPLMISLFHGGATYEMRSKPSSGHSANQCTYDTKGKIALSQPAAGSADRVSNTYSSVGHTDHDIGPFLLAESLGRIADYYLYRRIIVE